ncbi:MAG: SPL family radical SAM protein [bacterium]
MSGRNCSPVRYPINRLIVEQGTEGDRITRNVLDALPSLIPEYIEYERIKSLDADRHTIIVTHNRGKFLKRCPGTKEYLCCLYGFLNVGLNCPIDCTYCILQVYLNTNALVLFSNHTDMLAELGAELIAEPSLVRIGTGELTDSLALDPLTGLSPLLIDFFSGQRQAFLELKTKSDHVEHLLHLDHRGQTIISWSLNPQSVAESEEGLAAPVQARITAAKRCLEHGYRIGFHFDPIILYKGWESGYESLIDLLFSHIPPHSITWISMGCFRFIPPLKGIIRQRFPASRITYEEFIPGLDKKMRYPQPVRIHIYSSLAGWIRKRSPEAFIYLCMESPEVWKAALGEAPGDNEVLKSWLDERCKKAPIIEK